MVSEYMHQFWHTLTNMETGKGVEALTKQKMNAYLEIPLPHIRK